MHRYNIRTDLIMITLLYVMRYIISDSSFEHKRLPYFDEFYFLLILFNKQNYNKIKLHNRIEKLRNTVIMLNNIKYVIDKIIELDRKIYILYY